MCVAVPTLVYVFTASILPSGIAVMVIATFLFRNSLARAGFNVALIRLSSFSTAGETLLKLLAGNAHLALYIILANQRTFLDSCYDATRLILATTLASFLPVTLYALSQLFRK